MGLHEGTKEPDVVETPRARKGMCRINHSLCVVHPCWQDEPRTGGCHVSRRQRREEGRLRGCLFKRRGMESGGRKR